MMMIDYKRVRGSLATGRIAAGQPVGEKIPSQRLAMQSGSIAVLKLRRQPSVIEQRTITFCLFIITPKQQIVVSTYIGLCKGKNKLRTIYYTVSKCPPDTTSDLTNRHVQTMAYCTCFQLKRFQDNTFFVYRVPILYNGPMSHWYMSSQTVLSTGGLDRSLSNTCCLWLLLVSIGSTIFAQLTVVPNIQT